MCVLNCYTMSGSTDSFWGEMGMGKAGLVGDAEKLLHLRHSLGWTQDDAAEKSGYTSRLIRKMETGGAVKPSTLLDVLHCYHEAREEEDWCMADFIAPEVKPDNTDESIEQANPEPKNLEDTSQITLIKSYFETVFNQRHLERVSEFVCPNVRFTHGGGEEQVGIQVIEQLAEKILTGFDPIRHSISQVFVADGQVYCFWRVEMKHVGEFGGVDATGKLVKSQGLTICRFERGLMVEANDNWDVYDVIRQLSGEPDRWF